MILTSQLRIAFGQSGNSRQFEGRGWSFPEDGYTWALGQEAVLVLPAFCRPTLIAISGFPATSDRVDRQRIQLSINGTDCGEHALFSHATISCPIPPAAIATPQEARISLRFPDALRPCDVGESPDTRLLAVAVTEVVIDLDITLPADTPRYSENIATAVPRCSRTAGLPRHKTLVFCTAYAQTLADWECRYRLWLDAILYSQLQFDQVLLIDDGSPTLPDWSDVAVVDEGQFVDPGDHVIIYHYRTRLGRIGDYDFPGWFRSFTFPGGYAENNDFTKIIHIESDAFLISDRIQNYIESINDGWVAFWCPRHNFPESAIQVIAGDKSLAAYFDLCQRPNSDFITTNIELQLPFTHVEKGFKGDRYYESQLFVPPDADYAAQTALAPTPEHLWWLGNIGRRKT